ncbi:permease prefix domain 1-containing protein [Edaphobacter paludis]|uniref:Permease prefix domain 1-containing protein n=1 Tax=Edaphobacter paludis TaxID=3035702 RepID=A0AAU7CZC7_9BACT
MTKPFHELRERLLEAGIAPRHVRRYLTELTDHLTDLTEEEERAGRSRADAESAALLRLGGIENLAKAMIEQRQFQSWSARAPWATFSVAPLLLLAGAYFVALFILWSGWKMFLPGADTPFGFRPSHTEDSRSTMSIFKSAG